jgi:1-acyl-sn-glycerol-3-phosphate acyltransferase
MQKQQAANRARVGLGQYAFRRVVRPVLRGLLRASTHLHIEGLHNIPAHGQAIIAFNHLGHLDSLLVVAFAPRAPEFIALADLMDVPGTGLALRAYGVIFIHRDEYDRQVIRAALDALNQGGLLALAPEARISPSAALEKGREGAAYLALKSGAPVVPVGVTGTQTAFGAWRKRQRPDVRVIVGAPFRVQAEAGTRRREMLAEAHSVIMHNIAQLLPVEYRGYWRSPTLSLPRVAGEGCLPRASGGGEGQS